MGIRGGSGANLIDFAEFLTGSSRELTLTPHLHDKALCKPSDVYKVLLAPARCKLLKQLLAGRWCHTHSTDTVNRGCGGDLTLRLSPDPSLQTPRLGQCPLQEVPPQDSRWTSCWGYCAWPPAPRGTPERSRHQLLLKL